MITRSNGRVLALLVMVLAVGAAQAAPPVFVPAPFVDFTDATTCGFPLEVHFTVNGQTAKIFSDGTIRFTGPVKATYSANGKSVSLNIAGPGEISPTGTFTAQGVGAGPTELPNGELTFGYLAGQVELNFSPSGPSGAGGGRRRELPPRTLTLTSVR
jgi:hypothetical protein